MEAIGKKLWVIPEGYIPSESTGPAPDMTSHETVCILNTSDSDAHVKIMIYQEDRDPVGPYNFTIPARRTKHIKYNDMHDPESIPRDTPYASTIESDVPVVCQHSRLDSRQAENALMTTMAFPVDQA
jgi:hypothetical protein